MAQATRDPFLEVERSKVSVIRSCRHSGACLLINRQCKIAEKNWHFDAYVLTLRLEFKAVSFIEKTE